MTPAAETPDADLAAVRRFYAEEVRFSANISLPGLEEAFATVPRERFLGPGPWSCGGTDSWMGGDRRYFPTPDASPRHVYHNVIVSIDPARELNNGHPGTLAAWIDAVAPAPGERVVHVGSGTGYYTAIMAAIVGPAGTVTAIEVDRDLAARARENLAPWPQVRVIEGDATDLPAEAADVLFVNAGATHPLEAWLDALRPGGRLLLPLTFEPVPGAPGKGAVLRVIRRDDGFDARFVSMVAIYPCAGARDPEQGLALGLALRAGGWEKVRSLSRAPHEKDAGCWLHGKGWCLRTEDGSRG